ncbi:ABC transporter ATP-binding protein [Anoxybacillus flavithermus]|uniref:ABC transporter ATP-binding protein n=1 Tax=Anoxybacillus flavithermus TaxID=33934 RepID=UPI00186955A9|nr:ABC transporter ATP-binding protein [Anoxybacillus flavithermus]MBE2940085.1 ABC transporter ATP-binding protein [Anoxybacillus flavithermus]MBE2942838.1 ABC transporter ATP-binding protein [Anoxybacillus flavithermus]MBE2951176.1 ABC transporter ATP-binding protein [Anoxybacillus flavithermus]MBE2953826.1 ABC transporter ATP-binding protein [Anoxybacillus flavithermus]MBE2959063.1 ABC transporter ATP-binding protein [Anoxybacillus flavithermus]
MSSDIAIKVENLSKIYQIYDKPIDRLKQSLFRGRRKYYREFTALNNVSFQIRKGETVGIIGRNGSGKSTLLQILAGTLTPTSGSVEVNGRVAALLELGSGFNPEFTGRENVYMNGAILGISKEEMDRRFNEIAEFADIGDFIDQPVKTYSSGMYVRLAFSIAINVDADILIVDEALAVGDIKFQIKCIDKMKEIKNKGTTILFVSHSGEQVKRFCDRAIWLQNGNVRHIGSSSEVVNQYEDSLQLEMLKDQQREVAASIEKINKNEQETELNVDIIAKINSVTMDKIRIKTFEELVVYIKYTIFTNEVPNFLLGVAIYGNDRKYIFGPNTYLDKVNVPKTKGTHTVMYKIPKVPLLAGTYFVDAGIFTDGGLVCIDYKNDVCHFNVESDYFTEGLVHIEHEWRVVK